MRSYGTVPTYLAKAKWFRAINQESRYVYLMLLASGHANRLGLWYQPAAYAVHDLQITERSWDKAMGELVEAGAISHDPDTDLILVRDWVAHEVVRGESQAKGALSDIESLPDSPLLAELLQILEGNNKPHLGIWVEALRARIANLDSTPKAKQEESSTIAQGKVALSALQSSPVQTSPEYSPEPPEAASGQKLSPVVLTIPLVKKDGEFAITQADIDQWQDTFPGIDVLQALKQARQWSLDNPARRKTKAGIRKHLTGWLGRAQDKGHRSPPPSAPPAGAAVWGNQL